MLLVTVLAMVAAACSSGGTEEASTTTAAPSEGTETTTTAAPSEGTETTTTAAAGDDTEGMTSAERAVAEAQQYSGITLDVTWEAGLQAIDPITFSGPLWEELTGIKINVVELDQGAMFSAPVADKLAGGSAFDVVSLFPSAMPDFVSGGVIDPIDDFVTKYMVQADLDDYHPLYKGLGLYEGKRYGLFDDGDTLIMYYRTDIFEELGLEVPKTWDELSEVAQTITDAKAPDVYGWATWRNGFNDPAFFQQFRSNGGVPFDVDNDMRALINSPAAILTAEQMLAQNAAGPPGVESFGVFDAFASYLEGKLAMTMFWPPLGRWAASYGVEGNENLSFLPESQVGGITGYAVMPGGNGEHAGAFNLSVYSGSDAKEAAYLFIQWMTSPEISLQRVQLDTALRDPYRLSHYDSEEYKSLWPDAAEYLEVLEDAADVALIDLIIPGATEYNTAIDQAMTAIWAGTDPQAAFDTAASEWDRITDEIGVDAAREAWLTYLELPGSSVETTVKALGLAR
ncbi:MAG: sugar ABC transporter substrate-binding protein [Actinomycetia bacterium]|nr:sugar ABC transporter substrate-binding protein [Actinomycetes bacterium]